MKKFNLSLENLKVDSFETSKHSKTKNGTIRGQGLVTKDEGETCATNQETCYSCDCVYTVNYPGICVESEAVGSCPYQNC